MKEHRHLIIVEDETTGRMRRFRQLTRLPLISPDSEILFAFTLSFRRVAAIAVIVLGFPVLITLGARWAARAELERLQANARTWEVENASYRAATKELTDQIESLQAAVNEVGRQGTLDPATARALSKLPAVTRARAAGGGAGAVAHPTISALFTPALASAEDTFGVLRDLLGRLEGRLRMVRADVQRQAELASATPTIWPAHGWLSATFGSREDPINGAEAFHTGLDISTDKGKPVYATANGIIEAASYNGAYGNLLVIKHGFGLTTRYAHLSGFAVQPGQSVQRGDVIGYVGATGRTTGPHLHYEILVNGQPINPLQLLLEPRR